ncbi:MAG: SOS response-associated peptidase family protein, partial [Bacteroidota bacterium]
DGQELYTFSVITTEPNAEMEGIHNRMPVLLLNHEQQQQWLQELPLEDTLELLQTPPDGILKHYRVSQRVNSVRNNGSDLHEAVNDDPLTLF